MGKPVKDRLTEFSVYHRDGDGECNAIVLKKYAEKRRLGKRDKFDLSYFFSVVYCCESGIILFNNIDCIKEDPIGIAKLLKKDMIFQSDRKYMKMRNCFENAMKFWTENLQTDTINKYVNQGILDLQKAIDEVEKWYMFGRFSAFLFLETYATLMDLEVTDTTIDWPNGDTATSGLLNLSGKDQEAEAFDKTGKLTESTQKMDAMLEKVREVIRKVGGDTNTTKIETSLCAYRKFYKGTRYDGYYLDRMLEELNLYCNKKEYDDITKDLFGIRKKCFKSDFLGELHGWSGVRKEQKKLYMEYGII